MKKIILPSFVMLTKSLFGQTNPAITNWLINITGLTGRH